MKRVLAAFAVLGVLTGCGAQDGGAPSPAPKVETGKARVENLTEYVYEQKVTIEDGRTITCLVYATHQGGGLSCDWTPK